MTSQGRRDDPYRVLFEQLASGAARCRLVGAVGAVGAAVELEILDANPAFAAFRALVPQLVAPVARGCASGQRETCELRVDARRVAVAVIPVGADEAMVVLDDTTAGERLEQSSRASEDRFEQAFHGNAAAMVIAHQRDLRIVDVNPRWLELFGATRAEVIGRTSVELGLISESSARTRIAEHQQFADGYDIELALRTRSGGPLTVLASAKPIEIAEGRCTLTTLIDITGRKHAEEAFAAAFSASPAGMVLVDAETSRVIAVNDRMLELTLYDRDDFIGRDTHSIGFVRTPQRAELLAELARAGRLDAVEIELARKDGVGVWTLGSTERITLHDREHRLTVFTDIADRKRVERRLLTQHAVGLSLADGSELEVAMPRVIAALCLGEAWSCGAVWLPGDSDGALQCRGLWSDLAENEELSAATRQTILAFNTRFLSQVLATGSVEAIAIGVGPMRTAYGNAALAAGMRCAVAFPILRGSDVLGVVALAARRENAPIDTAERGLFDSVGRMLGLFVERTRAETSLRELNAELERRVLERTHALATSNRDLEAFSSSVSHDLSAPLRAINGFSAVLLEDFANALPAKAQQLLTSIHASGGRLRELIDHLLEFSRLGRTGMRARPIDLDALVRSVIDELVAGRDLGDRLEVQLGPLGTCHGDLSLLRAVWTNLIDNALKYSRTRPHIVIEIGAETRDVETVYYVRDNGVGFDMAYANKLFGVFQRLHSASEYEGTGVGLASVRRIVELHRGRVAARSELERGSTFEFTLGADAR